MCYKFERERKPHLVPVKDALGKVLEQLAGDYYGIFTSGQTAFVFKY